jgi:DnaJ family protein B protein 12
MNKDEALRCLDISRRHSASGNLASALKFARKSCSLHSTAEGEHLLKDLERRQQQPRPDSSDGPRQRRSAPAQAQSEKTRPSSAPIAEPIEREYTAEQVAAVRRVKQCGDNLYGVLGVEKNASESELKKAYRKVCILLIMQLV